MRKSKEEGFIDIPDCRTAYEDDRQREDGESPSRLRRSDVLLCRPTFTGSCSKAGRRTNIVITHPTNSEGERFPWRESPVVEPESVPSTTPSYLSQLKKYISFHG